MNLRKAAIIGIKWTTIGTIGNSLFQILQVSILTRFLPKEAFGQVAMALFVVNFSNIFVDMGMTSAILHRQNATKNEYSSIYWFNLIISLLLYAILLLGTPTVSKFYKEPELYLLVPITGINLIFMASGRQHRTIMQKQFRFKAIAIIESFSYFSGLISATLLAINNFGVYSLVYSTLLSTFISNCLFLILNLRLNPIYFHFNLKETRPFLKIGGFTTGSTILDFISNQADILIIGKMLGAESLGVYSLAKQIVLKLYSIINPIILNVLSPILSSIQKEKEKIKFHYLKIIYVLATLNFPIYFFIIISSKEILEILYGPNYISSYLVLSFLAISYAINTIGNPVGSLQIATGRTDIGFKWTIIRILITPIVIYFSSLYTITMVAASIALLSNLLVIPAWKIMLKPLADIKLKEYLQQFWKPYIILLILSGISFFVIRFDQFKFSPYLNATLKGISGIFIFLIIIYIFEKSRIYMFIKLIKQYILKKQ